MTVKTASDVASKWNSRLKASTDQITLGIGRVQTSPMAQAAAKQDKMLARLTAAVQSGKWKAGLNKVSLDEWKTQMLNKGVPRISGGADAALPKVTDFMTQLLPAVTAAQDVVSKMPDLTLEDAISRMTAFVRTMSKFKKS